MSDEGDVQFDLGSDDRLELIGIQSGAIPPHASVICNRCSVVDVGRFPLLSLPSRPGLG